jgi:hypothetical protein
MFASNDLTPMAIPLDLATAPLGNRDDDLHQKQENSAPEHKG